MDCSVGFRGGKLVFLGGKLPLNLQTQFYYNVVRPDVGPKWQWRAQAQILLPTSLFAQLTGYFFDSQCFGTKHEIVYGQRRMNYKLRGSKGDEK